MKELLKRWINMKISVEEAFKIVSNYIEEMDSQQPVADVEDDTIYDFILSHNAYNLLFREMNSRNMNTDEQLEFLKLFNNFLDYNYYQSGEIL